MGISQHDANITMLQHGGIIKSPKAELCGVWALVEM